MPVSSSDSSYLRHAKTEVRCLSCCVFVQDFHESQKEIGSCTGEMCCRDVHFLKGAAAFSCQSSHITACKTLTDLLLAEINKYNSTSRQ